MPTRSSDAIVIGGGHNGVVCAAYLARGGRKVTLIESADALGGAARTVEFAPGYRVSPVAHILNQLHPSVVRDLSLTRHGLEYAATGIPTTALSTDGNHLIMRGAFGDRIDGNIEHTDAAAWTALRQRLLRFAKTLQPLLARTPPRLRGGNRTDLTTLATLGWRVRRLGRADMRQFMRMALMNIADALEEEISDPRLQGVVAFDAVLGTHLGPRSPGSLLTLLYRLAGEAAGTQAALALPKGGMGAVTAALQRAAEAAGVTIRTGAAVSRIVMESGRAVGVTLNGGDELRAPLIVSGINPRTTFFDLVGPTNLDTGIVRRIKNIRMRGNAAKLHLALDGLPPFRGVAAAELAGRLVIAPNVAYVEKAFNPAKYGDYSGAPAMEIIVPSASDPSFAPAGRHVLSAIVQYAPYRLKAGWSAGKADFLKTVLTTLNAYAPGIGERIVASELLTPADLEQTYRMPGGHWHHGELAVDQMLMLRPVPGAAQYETPVPGLYLCGAGSHPGGGVMGAAGHNAARHILARGA